MTVQTLLQSLLVQVVSWKGSGLYYRSPIPPHIESLTECPWVSGLSGVPGAGQPQEDGSGREDVANSPMNPILLPSTKMPLRAPISIYSSASSLQNTGKEMTPSNYLFKKSISDGLPPVLVPEATQIPLTAFCPQKPGQAMFPSQCQGILPLRSWQCSFIGPWSKNSPPSLTVWKSQNAWACQQRPLQLSHLHSG